MSIPIFNKNFWEGLGAGFGLLPVREIPYMPMDDKDIILKIQELNDQNGPVFYLSTNHPPQFFNRAVMRNTHSWASHAGVFVPERWAREIRKRHPDLLEKRDLSGIIAKQHKVLPAVPADVCGPEIVESKALVSLSKPEDVFKPGEIVVAFTRNWTDEQADAILYAAYYMYGLPYDVLEIGSWTSWIFPNFNQLKVCSTLVETSMEGRDPMTGGDMRGDKEARSWLMARGINPDRVSPGELGRYLFSSSMYKALAINCDLKQAEEII